MDSDLSKFKFCIALRNFTVGSKKEIYSFLMRNFFLINDYYFTGICIVPTNYAILYIYYTFTTVPDLNLGPYLSCIHTNTILSVINLLAFL